MPLWKTEALARAMGATITGNPPAAVSGISIDSRTIGEGEVFYAIKGDRFDGHDYVEAALSRGAVAAVVSREWAASAKPGRYLIVPDVLRGLEDAGRAARARTPAKIVGITGSVGKTSTKEMLASVLSREGETHAAKASFNNHWGVPLTLARMPAGSRFAVFEIGMNHAGEITPLTAMVRPDIAIITTVEAVHIENFPSIEGIADAKGEILTGVEPGGTAVLNRDNRFFDRLSARARSVGIEHIVSFGEHEEADVRLVRVVLKPECSCVQARVFGVDLTYKVGAPGRHLVMNSLAVLSAAKLSGADLAVAAMALAEQRAVKGRGQRHVLTLTGGTFTLFDESYNANPVSVRAALEVVGKAEMEPKGRRIAVLGDMLELGAQGPADHAGLASSIVANKIDLVFCCGPLMKNLWEALPAGRRGAYAASAAELESVVVATVRPGDVVTIKGSLGSKMGPIVDVLMRRFPAVVSETPVA
ncbi:MAG: UDP-N-acetylmuramoylalanyl-D-glutamyl-2,6-diaminopimelate--D-alanyl-D-alanine ligase [Alphaproteobacteria bacterium]